MTDPIVLPPMTAAQDGAWHALMDLAARFPANWALIGGQLVHLHCAERGAAPARPTDDADTVVDVRASPEILTRFTKALKELGFSPDTSGDGVQHRWRNGAAQIDVLIPEGLSERARSRPGVDGAPTVSAPGTTQALNRAEPVVVQAGERVGTILRPNIVGALVGKAAARTEIATDTVASRHCVDFVILAGLISARDFRDDALSRKDRKRLRAMLEHCRKDEAALSVASATESLNRLERAARLTD